MFSALLYERVVEGAYLGIEAVRSIARGAHQKPQRVVETRPCHRPMESGAQVVPFPPQHCRRCELIGPEPFAPRVLARVKDMGEVAVA